MSKEQSTEFLSSRLTQARSLEEFEKQHGESIQSIGFNVLLQQLIAQKGLTLAVAIKKANITKSYAYQLISGDREPSRDKVIAFCLGLELSLEAANRLLRAAYKAPLYVKEPRDLVIIFALSNGYPLVDTNILLDEKGYAPIE